MRLKFAGTQELLSKIQMDIQSHPLNRKLNEETLAFAQL